MYKRISFALITGFLIVFATGCDKHSDKYVSEGVIEYKAEVMDPNNPMASFAPNSMRIKFKNDKSKVELTAGMGLFTTSFISDPEQKTMTQLVKLMSKKYVHIAESTDIEEEKKALGEIEIIPTDSTKIIAGLNCKEAIVRFKDDNVPEFKIYYTNEVGINDPNWSNPFYEVDGVLMEYQMKRYGLDLRFTASSVTAEPVDNSEFDMPEGYQKISRAEMEDLFGAF